MWRNRAFISEAASAVCRFGMGARPGEIERVAVDPRGWLRGQVEAAAAAGPAGPRSVERLAALAALGDATPDQLYARSVPVAMEEASARAAHAIGTPNGFAERWALFWTNHFSIKAARPEVMAAAGAYEREAVRPHVFGLYEDLALAALRHPVMLLYYDQEASAGPNSAYAQGRGLGFNENLGRETLELYTVGLKAGYSQRDVAETALALTGWGIDAKNHRQVFRSARHEPGPRRVLGAVYAPEGARQSETLIRDLARHPATGRRLAQKIARHFVGDAPPASLVARLADGYRRSGGSLTAVALALIEAEESWAPSAAKFKTPYEFYVSVSRALERPPSGPREAGDLMVFMEHTLWQPPTPEGWPDHASAWSSSAALMRRIAWVRELSDGPAPAMRLAEEVLGDKLKDHTRGILARAAPADRLALLFLSPEFQWR